MVGTWHHTAPLREVMGYGDLPLGPPPQALAKFAGAVSDVILGHIVDNSARGAGILVELSGEVLLARILLAVPAIILAGFHDGNRDRLTDLCHATPPQECPSPHDVLLVVK